MKLVTGETEAEKEVENDSNQEQVDNSTKGTLVKRGSRVRQAVYNSRGYLKRQKQDPSILIRQRRQSTLSEQSQLGGREERSSAEELMRAMNRLKDLNLAEKDAKEILEYMKEWQREQNEEVIQQVRQSLEDKRPTPTDSDSRAVSRGTRGDTGSSHKSRSTLSSKSRADSEAMSRPSQYQTRPKCPQDDIKKDDFRI